MKIYPFFNYRHIKLFINKHSDSISAFYLALVMGFLVALYCITWLRNIDNLLSKLTLTIR